MIPPHPADATIRVGIGGWNYAPWRDTFYPADVPVDQELAYASRRFNALEVNATFYRLQRPEVYARWAAQTPDDFVFALKAPRFVTQQKSLRDAAPGIDRFITSGITTLGPKLGPLLWQLAPYKRFDAAEIDAFLGALPRTADGLVLRHALELRHPSFVDPAYVALARRHGVATVFAESDDYPRLADLTGDFVYLRLMRHSAAEPEGLPVATMQQLAHCLHCWRDGGEPTGLPRAAPDAGAAPAPGRDVFAFFIAAAKEIAPAAALGLRRALQADN